jgi:hypothetical protein
LRLDSVEIKTTIAGAQVDRALEVFGFAPKGQRLDIYFCDDVTRGVSTTSTPLLDLGVVLRARDWHGGGADSTIKLRPCRRSQLTDQWLENTSETNKIKVEADWAGDRKVLAASCTASLPDDRIAHVHAGRKALPSLFSADQERFLKDCAGIRVNLSMLTLLGPVTAWRWKPIQTRAPDPTLELQAERWTVDHTLDFLELSTRVKPADADAAKSAFDELICRRGFPLDADQENKTQRVLAYLVGNVTRTSAGLEPSRR